MGGRGSKGSSEALDKANRELNDQKAKNQAERAAAQNAHNSRMSQLNEEYRDQKNRVDQLREMNDQIYRDKQQAADKRKREMEEELNKLNQKNQEEFQAQLEEAKNDRDAVKAKNLKDEQEIKSKHNLELQKINEEMRLAKIESDRQLSEEDEKSKEIDANRKKELDNYKKTNKELWKKHNDKINEEIEKMWKAKMEDYEETKNMLKLETSMKLAILEENNEIARRSAIQQIHQILFDEFIDIVKNAGELDLALGEIVGYLEDIPDNNDDTYLAKQFNSEFALKSRLMNDSVSSMSQRLKKCFEISDVFRKDLMVPLQQFENEYTNVCSLPNRINLSIERRNVTGLRNTKDLLVAYKQLVNRITEQINAIEGHDYVQKMLDEMKGEQQAAIEN